MKSTPFFSFSAAILLISSFQMSGCEDSDRFSIYNEDGTPVVGTYDFGTQNLGASSSKTFILNNLGAADLKLKSIDTTSLFLAVPFTVSGGTCTSNSVIPSGQSCSIIITFEPKQENVSTDEMTVKYIDNGNEEITSVELRGKGFLDCNASPELFAAFQDGAIKANNQMALDRQAGTAAGAALTYDDGKNDGYRIGYDQGYDIGYNSSQGYDGGYETGFNDGYFHGIYSSTACWNGKSDGSNDGDWDGSNAGDWDGYSDGYADGWTAGNSDGYSSGYYEGSSSCLNKNKVTPFSLPSYSDFSDACFRKGYTATYDSSAYNNAYDEAIRNNSQYQNGYSTYYQFGRDDGRSDGISQGWSDGHQDGETDGYLVGYDEAYWSCYYEQYYVTYSYSYDDAYTSAYPGGWNSGYDSGWSSGWQSGYNDGLSSCGGTWKRPVIKARASFGTGKTWWTKTKRGLYAPRVSIKKNPKPILNEKQISDIQSRIQKIRGSGARTELRKTLFFENFIESRKQKK